MATYEVTSPTGEVYEVNAPDNATEAQVLKYAQDHVSKNSSMDYQLIDVPEFGRVQFPANMSDDEIVKAIKRNTSDTKPKPWERYQQAAPKGKPWERYQDTNNGQAETKSKDVTDDMSTTQKLLAGVGQGITSMARGIGQVRNEQYDLSSKLFPDSQILNVPKIATATKEDEAKARKLDAPLLNTMAGKIGSVGGQLAPTMLIPGLNSYAGATLIGGGLGMIQPVVEGESRELNTALGMAGGLAGQKVGNTIGSAINKRVASNSLAKAQNATRDETVKAVQKIGFKLPRSLYNPSFKSNMIESFGGKAATLQQASAKNQEIVNSLTRKALDLPDNTPLSMATIDKVRLQAYKPYQELASISKGAKNALEQLKQAKSDANAWFNSYNRSANPEHLAKAKDFQEVADIAEQVIEDYARQAGKGGLVSQLREARKMIAKTYTVERAMNKGTGDIDARVLGRLFDKGKPLSDGLDDIGRFAASFPKAAQPTQQSAGAGISALEPLSSAVYGAAGHMATGSPTGMLAAGIPMLRSPARALALSRFMQSTPTYGGGILSTANKVSPLLPYVGGRAGGLLGTNSY